MRKKGYLYLASNGQLYDHKETPEEYAERHGYSEDEDINIEPLMDLLWRDRSVLGKIFCCIGLVVGIIFIAGAGAIS